MKKQDGAGTKAPSADIRRETRSQEEVEKTIGPKGDNADLLNICMRADTKSIPADAGRKG